MSPARGRVGRRRAVHLLVGEVGDAAVEADDRAQVGHLTGSPEFQDRRQETVLDEDGARRRAPQQVGQLAGSQAPVQRHHDRARGGDPHLDLHELEPVGAEDRDAVHLLDA
jgi:hypothetical protein